MKDIISEQFFRDHDISLYGASWTKHLVSASPEKIEGFKNQLFMISISVDDAKKNKICTRRVEK